MSYGKLDENAKKRRHKTEVMPVQTEQEVRRMMNEIEEEPERELFMETEHQLRANSAKKNIFVFCCGFVVLVLIAAFVGYVFQQKLLDVTDERSEPDTHHNETNTNTSYFIRSPTDTHREFELITLDNSLQILLISDNKTDKSAAAIDVAIGSNEDPHEYLGLAHFHEHMLFLGSETYPSEDAFSGFVSMNGGGDNAYTDNTHTNFFFNINNDHLSHALDVFSRFFIDPLLTQEAIMDEIWAVDNEYRKDIPNQDWRDWRMLEYSANPNDPFSTFSIGSIETLNKSGTYSAMRAFHDKYFVSTMMKGVIYGNQNLSTLRSYATQYFSNIRRGDIEEAPRYEETQPFGERQKGLKYFIKPMVDSTKKLSFVWSFVAGNEYDLHKDYRSPILQLIDGVMTSQTNHSLYDLLAKKKGWIDGISGDTISDEYQWNGYALSFDLTDSGLAHDDEITKYLFLYINVLLENVYRVGATLFADYECLQSIYFKFYSLLKQDAYGAVSGIARRMQYRAQCDLLYTNVDVAPDRLLFNESAMQNVLMFMADPNNFIMYKTSNDYSGEYDAIEPYFGIEFATERISAHLKTQLRFVEQDAAEDELQITFSNPYIGECNVDEIELIELTKNDNISLVYNASNVNVWYKAADPQFATPQIAVNLLLIHPWISANALNKTYSAIWIALISHVSSSWYAQPNGAGYAFEISISDEGLVIEMTCLNPLHLSRFVDRVLNYVMQIESYSLGDEELVVRNIANSLYSSYNEMNYDSVWRQGYEVMNDIVRKPYDSHHVMLDVLNQFNNSVLHNVYNFVREVKQYGFLMEILFHGNLYEADVETYRKQITNAIDLREETRFDTLFENVEMKKHLNLQLNGATRHWIYRGRNSNPSDTNDVNEFYFQFNDATVDHVEKCKVLLIAKMMSSESFEVLRTQEALGYVATTFALSTNINYVVLLVASGHHSADYLHRRVAHFVEYFGHAFLANMTNESFASYVDATVSDVNKVYLSMPDETQFLWNQIVGHTYDWNIRKELERILRQQITLNDMKSFYATNVLGTKSKWLSLQLYHEETLTFAAANNITQYNYDLTHFPDSVVYFDSPKDIQRVRNISFFDVY